MRVLSFFVSLVFSLSASASWIEVECSGNEGSKTVRVEIEEAWPNGSFWKPATVVIDRPGQQDRRDYVVTTRFVPGFSSLEYANRGFRLEVDLWPDQRPRWNRLYRGTFQSDAMGDMNFRALKCRFPNAF
jgi:hypothetical protein